MFRRMTLLLNPILRKQTGSMFLPLEIKSVPRGTLCASLSSSVPIYFVDAFTTNNNAHFTGNTAAVCFLDADQDIPDDMKQKIAGEVNQNVTSFVSLRWLKSKPDGLFFHPEHPISSSRPMKCTIRWFIPTREIPLCGHGLLASVKALVEILFQKEKLRRRGQKHKFVFDFETRTKGTLQTCYHIDSGMITLSMLSSPTVAIKLDEGISTRKIVERTLYPAFTPEVIQDIHFSPSSQIILLRLADSMTKRDLETLCPDFEKLKSTEKSNEMFGVLVTVKGKNPDVKMKRPHIYSRFFAPWVGINEDPACGAAHTLITPYWSKEYFVGFGDTLLARQHSKRGADLYCSMVDSERVILGGQARVILKGDIRIRVQ